jgi:hypothetical protein
LRLGARLDLRPGLRLVLLLGHARDGRRRGPPARGAGAARGRVLARTLDALEGGGHQWV